MTSGSALRDNARLTVEPFMSDLLTLSHDDLLDASGLNCPEPVMMLHNKERDLQSGGLLKVIATDPSTRRDIPKLCVFLGHERLGQAGQDGAYLYWIRKKSE